jgi:protocatechuate 3,4-dioxygenase beta subunit
MCRFKILPSFSVVVLGLGLLPANLAGQNSTPVEGAATTGGFHIAGKVVNALGGGPLARARVTIVDTKNQQKTEWTLTSEDGSFRFLKLGRGKYALKGAKRGFIPAAYEQHGQYSTAIVTGAGLDTEHLVLRLAPDALLAGTVLDESGEPVRRAIVSLYREDRQVGVERIHKVRTETTDDQGAYEFYPLDSGTYFVSAVATPWYAVHRRSPAADEGNRMQADRSLDVAYPEAYYKDATEPQEASPILLRGGDRLEADIHLNPVPALHLIYRVPDQERSVFTLPDLRRSVFDGVDGVPNQSWESASPGVFETDGVAPGTYTVTFPGMGPDSSSVDLNLDLNADGQEIDATKGEPAGRLKASLRMVGGEKPPQSLIVTLRNSKFSVVGQEEVDGNGEVEFDNVAPGKYEVLVQGPQRAYSLVRISSAGAETAGDRLNVVAGRSLAVSLLVAGSTMNVEGFATSKGHPVAGAMVVLVPKDPEANRTLFRRDQSDLDGSFDLLNVIPGSYTIVAIDNGWDLDWASPAVIQPYSRHGKTITVGESQGSMHLPDAVEVQAQ